MEKSGAWLSYGELRIGQGRENAKQFLKENPELASEIETKLRKALGLNPVETATEKMSPPPPVDAEPPREREKARR